MEWWSDQEGKITCCRFATQEEQEADPEAYNCEDCQERILKDSFTRADKVALHLYEDLAHSVVADFHLTPLVFDLHRLQLTEEEAQGLLQKLDLVHCERLTVARRQQERASKTDQTHH